MDPQDHPVVEAAVYLVSAPVPMPDIAQLTDEEGRFSFAAQSPGSYTIGVHSDRWGTTQKTIEVSAEEALEVQFHYMED